MDDTAMTNPARLRKPTAEGMPCDVRMQKVEQLRAAIASGQYRVSSEALAERLMEHMHALDGGDPGKRS